MKNFLLLLFTKMNGRKKFLVIVLVLYSVIWIFNPTIIKDALIYSLITLMKVLPILCLVFVILFCFNLFLKAEKISRYLGCESGLLGWLYAVIGGIIVSGPPYVLYPMLGELKKHGARSGLIVTLLYN